VLPSRVFRNPGPLNSLTGPQKHVSVGATQSGALEALPMAMTHMRLRPLKQSITNLRLSSFLSRSDE
jgi:hypothetical protein